jgi:hypothetical protein
LGQRERRGLGAEQREVEATEEDGEEEELLLEGTGGAGGFEGVR